MSESREGRIVWITGAPGSGKTTTAARLARLLPRAIILDGDDCRHWLTPDCDFSEVGRRTHAERVWAVAEQIASVGGTAIVALVAHPPKRPDCLIWMDGPARTPLWPGTSYTPPDAPDLVVYT